MRGGAGVKGQGSVSRYRFIDLSFFALMVFVSETVIVTAAVKWFPREPYTVSAVAAVTAIVMIRWGPWAAIHAVLGGVAFCLASGAAPWQYAVYCGGNLLALAALPLTRGKRGEALRQDSFRTVVYALAVQLLMQAGRALLSLIAGASLTTAAGFFTTDVISLLFTALLLWITRRLDGMLEDQKHYLHRTAKEREEEKGGF